MARKTSHTALSLGTLAIAVVLFAAFNIFSNRLLSGSQIDLTDSGIYTLSDGTKNIMGKLEEPITLRLFYSEEQATGYPVIQSYASRIRGLLKQYESMADGMITLEFINPKPFTEEEDLAVALGVAAAPIDALGNKLYFGLSAENSTAERVALPFLDPDKSAFVEYDITRMIYDLAQREKQKIGVMSWMPMQGGGVSMMDIQPPWVILDEMKRNFEVEKLGQDVAEIPADIDVLMVVHPPVKGVSEDTQYAIDQFVLKGGRALVFADPYTKVDGTEHTESNLTKLFHAWGVDMPERDVVADPSIAIRMRDEQRGSALGLVSNPVWLNLQRGNFNSSELVTSEMEVMRFIASGHFVPWRPEGEGVAAASTEMVPLVLSGMGSLTIPNFKLMFDEDPTQLLSEATPQNKMLVLAARVHGEAVSAFPERASVEGHVASSASPINVVVVGDADMLRDGFWVNRQTFFGKQMLVPTANNGSFVLNVLDVLGGSGDLIGLRSRIVPERPFDKVEAIQRDAEVKFREREMQLKMQLHDLEEKLNTLQPAQNEQTGELLFTPEHQAEFDRYKDVLLDTRKELRDVQRSLREDIDRMGSWVKFINIGLVPLFVLLLAWLVPPRLGMKRR